MAIDEVNTQHEAPSPGGSSYTPLIVAIFVILAALTVGEIYTLSQISSMRTPIEVQMAKMQKDQQDFMSRLAGHEQSEAQTHDALKCELEAGVKRTAGSDLRRTKAM